MLVLGELVGAEGSGFRAIILLRVVRGGFGDCAENLLLDDGAGDGAKDCLV